MKKDEALALLHQQDYFDPNKLSSILDEIVKRLGAWLDFLPQYHPEFNFIDMYWGHFKRKVITKCDYEWESFLVRVSKALDSVTLMFIIKA